MNGAPALLHVPPGIRGSYVDEVGEVMEMAGRPLDPHQLVAVDALTSYTTGGKWPTFIAGVEGPRQTVGKTGGIVLPIAISLCLMFQADERTWTAHRLDTTSKTFRDAQQLLGVESQDRSEWHGELFTRVRNVGRENGNEHIEFTNGSLLWFKARSGRAGRGLSGHDVFADEFLFATDEQMGAVLPTMATRSAQGMPRLWTASSSAKAESVLLRQYRALAEARDRSIVYVGWWARGSWEEPGCEAGTRCSHVKGTPGCALDDPERRAEANPGLGVRTSEAFLVSMRDALSPLEFGREFLGWQELADDDELPVTVAKWATRADPASKVADDARPVFSLDVAPDSRSASIGVAGRREDGRRHVGVIDFRRGSVGWVVPRLIELVERHDPLAVILDGVSPAAALLPTLVEDHGLTVWSPKTDPGGLLHITSAADMGAACVGLVNALDGDEALWHRGDPIVSDAWAAAAKRNIGDGMWGLARRHSEGDITAAVAVVLAHYGHAVHGSADYDLSESFA